MRSVADMDVINVTKAQNDLAAEKSVKKHKHKYKHKDKLCTSVCYQQMQ